LFILDQTGFFPSQRRGLFVNFCQHGDKGDSFYELARVSILATMASPTSLVLDVPPMSWIKVLD